MLTAFVLAIHRDAKVEQDSGLAQDYVSTLLENENQFKRKLHKIVYVNSINLSVSFVDVSSTRM